MMVERYIDKKIRVLQEILGAPNLKRSDSKGEPHPCKHIITEKLELSHSLVADILNELELGVSAKTDLGEIFSGKPDIGDYLFEVIVEDKDIKRLSALLKEYQSQSPKRQKPLIREKTLELISQKIGNIDTGSNLIKFLKDCGVDGELIVYPNTKWRMIFDALSYLAYSDKEEDKEVFSKVIGEATHPLMHGGSQSSANSLREEFNDLLHYDNFGIGYDEESRTYWALRKGSDEDADIQAQIESDEMIKHYEEQSEKQFKFLCKPENKEKISELRESYQLLTSVIWAFCINPAAPSIELNKNYQFLYKLINTIISDLKLWQIETTPFSRNQNFFRLPFSNLFSAEKVYREQGEELSWRRIRPQMYAMYGDIEELYQEVSGSDVLIEPDKQKKFNEIQLHLIKIRKKREEKRARMQDKTTTSQTPVQQIEIVGGRIKTEVEGLEKGLRAIAKANKEKKKDKFPHTLPAGIEWKNFIIQFLNKDEVCIKVNRFEHNEKYEKMGFTDHRSSVPRPNAGWIFLWVMAKYNGELTIKDPDAKYTYKKQKELLSKALKSYFSMESDPFYPYHETKSYKTRFTLFPPPEESKEEDKKHKIPHVEVEPDSVDEEIKQYFEEQTPQVYDERG